MIEWVKKYWFTGTCALFFLQAFVWVSGFIWMVFLDAIMSFGGGCKW